MRGYEFILFVISYFHTIRVFTFHILSFNFFTALATDYEIENPNFSFVQFRSNLVVRWEYIPGSEIYLVWSQGITSSADSLDDLFRGLETGILDQKPENIFLLKMTYRFVL